MFLSFFWLLLFFLLRTTFSWSCRTVVLDGPRRWRISIPQAPHPQIPRPRCVLSLSFRGSTVKVSLEGLGILELDEQILLCSQLSGWMKSCHPKQVLLLSLSSVLLTLVTQCLSPFPSSPTYRICSSESPADGQVVQEILPPFFHLVPTNQSPQIGRIVGWDRLSLPMWPLFNISRPFLDQVTLSIAWSPELDLGLGWWI